MVKDHGYLFLKRVGGYTAGIQCYYTPFQETEKRNTSYLLARTGTSTDCVQVGFFDLLDYIITTIDHLNCVPR